MFFTQSLKSSYSIEKCFYSFWTPIQIQNFSRQLWIPGISNNFYSAIVDMDQKKAKLKDETIGNRTWFSDCPNPKMYRMQAACGYPAFAPFIFVAINY